MQILKSPLGIKSPLLGIGASLSPPSLLLQKSSFPALLHGLIKPSTSLASSFSLSKSDFSQLSDGHVTEWNANKPHFEIHSFQQNHTIEVGKFKNNQLAKSSKRRVGTNTDSQSTDELTLQKQSKANKKQTKSKNNPKQSKSKKVAGASVSVEKVSQSLKQINSHDIIDSSEKISVNNALGDMTRELAGEFLESSHSTLQERQTVLRNPVDSEFPSVASSAPVMPLQELESDVTPTREQNILPQHPQLPNIIPPVVDGSSTLTPPQNLLTQHPVVVESPQFVESQTTSGDTTLIQASPQHRELLNIIPPVVDGDRTNILPQDIDLATTSNQVLQTTFKLDDGFNGSTHLQAEAVQKSVQSPPSLINTANNTSVLNITSDLGVQPTASESLPAVPNLYAYYKVNVNGKNSSNTVDREMRSHFPTSEPGEGARTMNAFINDSTEIQEDLPPPQGYAVGGHVTASNITGTPKIAPSDTVPAMLTPGEFVVNSKDAQKNLNLLKHINTSGKVPDDILTSPPSINKSEEQADEASVKTSTKVESSKGFPVQRKSSDERVPGTLISLVSSSPLLKTEKQGLTTLSSLQSNSSENKTTKLNESSSHYSSTPLIFRKRTSTTDSSSYSSNSPSQWTRIEELVNDSTPTEGSQLSTPVSFVNHGFEHQNSASTKLRSPKASTQNLLQLKSFANGKSGNPPDTFTPIQPVTEIIEPSSSEPTDTDSFDLETLAREIYHRLRQRLELERERHGSYSGRLPW